MFDMAHYTLPNLSSETTNPLSLLLVTKPPIYLPYNLLDLIESNTK